MCLCGVVGIKEVRVQAYKGKHKQSNCTIAQTVNPLPANDHSYTEDITNNLSTCVNVTKMGKTVGRRRGRMV